MEPSGSKWSMSMTGEYFASLDEKSRIILPVGIRKDFDSTYVVLTRGQDKCLWLYRKQKWEEKFAKEIQENTDPFSKADRRVLRKFLGTSHNVEMDKAGRMNVPEPLREYAGLTKDCVILGMLEYIEIWDKERYTKYIDEDNEENAGEFEAASEDLSRRIKQKKGVII